jgi:hypothetical protein
MLLATLADKIGTCLLEIAAMLLRYAEHQYAGDIELRDTQGLWHDYTPRSEAILAEILGQPGAGGDGSSQAASIAPFSAP